MRGRDGGWEGEQPNDRGVFVFWLDWAKWRRPTNGDNQQRHLFTGDESMNIFSRSIDGGILLFWWRGKKISLSGSMNAAQSLPFICSESVHKSHFYYSLYLSELLLEAMLWLCSYELNWISLHSHPGCQDMMHSSWINNDVGSLG